MDVMRALHITAQIASALAAAHGAGVIHRDLKPDNVMLTPRLGDPDFVKLLDFGLAKMFASSSAVKTAAGVLLGTPQYMSPEACESRATIDARTDVYALGILLFQMTTGMLPFDGESMGEVLVKQISQLPPPPRGINPNIPPAVEQIILRCLAKAPDGRFPTMNHLREALLDPEAYLRKSPPIAPARSFAPGEAPATAAQVIAYAQQQKTRIGTGSDLPLPAPAPSLHDAQKTLIAVEAPRRSTVLPVPDMQPPAAPKMNTMRIATPLGYSSRPPRKVWPIVLVAGLLLGLGGGAFAVAYFGKQGTTTAEAGTPAMAVTPIDAGIAMTPVRIDAAAVVPLPKPPDAAPEMAIVVIDSAPQGAEVIGPDRKPLGKTPAKLTLPVSQAPQTFELRLPGYRKKTRDLVVTGNTVITIPLEKAPVVVVPSHRGSAAHHNSGDDLERPE
jgi:serine/threonine-protein kinase